MTLIACLRHAARNRQTVSIGGGEFGPAELRAAANALESAPELLAALTWAVDQIEDDLDPDHQAALQSACLAIVLATSPEAQS